MAGWVDAIVSPLKAASEGAEKLMQLRDTVKFGDAVIELQAQIMIAQQGAFAAQSRETEMAEKIRELEAHLTELETWNAEKERYQLTDLGGGTFAYVLKQSMSNGEPEHRLCPSCFQKNEKSILQFLYGTTMSQDKYACPSCKHEFTFGVQQEPPALSSIVHYED